MSSGGLEVSFSILWNNLITYKTQDFTERSIRPFVFKVIYELDVHFELIFLDLYPLRNSMDPVSTVSGLDLDGLSKLNIS